jgi:hypothetical protein
VQVDEPSKELALVSKDPMLVVEIMGGVEFIEVGVENLHIYGVLLVDNNTTPFKKVDSSAHVPLVGLGGGSKPQTNLDFRGDGDFNFF